MFALSVFDWPLVVGLLLMNSGKSATAALPPSSLTTILISVRVKKGTAYVNLKDFRQIIPNTSASCASQLFLAEMDTTLKQFPSIKRAIYAIEGVPADFYGHLQMDCEDDPHLCDEAPFK